MNTITVDALLEELTRYKNGLVSEIMAAHGIHYKINYGASVPQIKSVVKPYAPNHELALEAFNRDERELKLAAIYLDNATQVTPEQVKLWSKAFTNTEIVEQMCMNLLWEVSFVKDLMKEWCVSKDELFQKAGWMLLGKQLKSGNKIDEEDDLNYFLALLSRPDATYSAHTSQAVTYALLTLSEKSAEWKNTVIQLAQKMLSSLVLSQQQLGNDLLSFLNEE